MSAAGPVVEVLVDLSARGGDGRFHYAVPGALAGCLRPGHRVRVPLGSRTVDGYVLGFVDQPAVAALRPVLEVVEPDPLLSAEQLELAFWLVQRYACSLVQGLRVQLPAAVRGRRARRQAQPVVRLALAPEEVEAQLARGELARAPAQRRVLACLLASRGPWSPAELARRSGTRAQVVARLVQDGWLLEERQELRSDPLAARSGAGRPGSALRPTAAQAGILRILRQAVGDGAVRDGTGRDGREQRAPVFLLHGVTGSGKTEVYLQAIAEALRAGRQAIVLVPEIALTPQTSAWFAARFGPDVAVLHSGLAPGERLDEWRRIRRQEVAVVVGARSAVFAPLARLGLIVVDEEHETTYKQEEAPRYDARAVARQRARNSGAAVVLGSATPSLESYFRARNGTYRLLELPERVGQASLPVVRVVDMRRELAAGNRHLFSRVLHEALAQRLSRGEQAVLFLNRRGFSSCLLCRECGAVVECPNCAVSLTYHAAQARLRCHYCAYWCRPPQVCPACGSRYLRPFGAGTQQVEAAVRQHFPGARVLRMDVDTTARRGAHERLYEAFCRGEADILVGTQMVAKGWDIERVTLVGVVSADTALHLPDFRRGERTFQLLTQVAGRAGRGSRPGEVVIQTYDPEHYAIRHACRHDYAGFYEREIALRRQWRMPPFTRLVRLLVAGPDPGTAEAACRRWVEEARRRDPDLPPECWIGPAEAPLARLKGRSRWHALLRGEQPARLRQVAQAALKAVQAEGEAARCRLAIDVDPMSFL